MVANNWTPLGSTSVDSSVAGYLTLDVPPMDHLMVIWRVTGIDGVEGTVPAVDYPNGTIPIMYFNNDVFRSDLFDVNVVRPPNWDVNFDYGGYHYEYHPVQISSSVNTSYSWARLMGHMSSSVSSGVLFISNIKNQNNQMHSFATSKGAHFLSDNERTGFTINALNNNGFDVTASAYIADTSVLPVGSTGMITRPYPSPFGNTFYPNNNQIGRLTFSLMDSYIGSFGGLLLKKGSGFSVFGYNLR